MLTNLCITKNNYVKTGALQVLRRTWLTGGHFMFATLVACSCLSLGHCFFIIPCLTVNARTVIVTGTHSTLKLCRGQVTIFPTTHKKHGKIYCSLAYENQNRLHAFHVFSKKAIVQSLTSNIADLLYYPTTSWICCYHHCQIQHQSHCLRSLLDHHYRYPYLNSNKLSFIL